MNAAKRARGELRAFANSWRGLLALDELLGESGDLDDRIAAQMAQIAAHDVTLGERQAAIGAADKEVSDRLASSRAAVQDAEEQARQVLKRAANDAAVIVDEGRAISVGLVIQARADAAAIADRSKDAVAALYGVSSQLSAKQAEFAVVEANIASSQEKLDAINAQIAALREKF